MTNVKSFARNVDQNEEFHGIFVCEVFLKDAIRYANFKRFQYFVLFLLKTLPRIFERP